MRLDDFDNSINVEHQGSGGFGGLPIGGGSVGCGGLVILLIGALVFGVDLSPLVSDGGAPMAQQTQQQNAPGAVQGTAACSTDENAREMCNALLSLNKTWSGLFAREGARFQPPKLSFYDQSGVSGCGSAQSAMGPFYCPNDQGIYLDTAFFRQMEQQLGASGDFARYYVIAHEYGHHIQTITGLSQQVQQAQARSSQAQGNAIQVRMELQADCYAGVWAAQNKDKIEPGDVQEGLRAASSIGDDVLMANSGRRVSPESFTHGTSQQRMEWLNRGLQTGDPAACDTFKG